jgi:hypothetical protein
MNVVDATVIEILSDPYSAYGKWFVRAKVTSWGAESEIDQMFYSESDAKKLKVGDTVHI